MAQWAKVLVAKPYALRSISVTHVLGEDPFPQVALWPPQTPWHPTP